MTFGEYLHKLLKDKHINLSNLAATAGIKSKNEIYRLFDNKYSYEKTKKLTDQILSVIEIHREEKNKLYRLMENCKIKNSVRNAWSILEGLYKGIEIEKDENIEKIGRVLEANRKSKIKIFIGYETNINISLFFVDLLSKHNGYDISIVHAVNFNKAEDIIAQEIFSLIKLLPHDEYKCFEVNKSELKGVIGLIKSSEKYHMFTVTENDKYVESQVSEELYELMLKEYSRCEKGTELKDMRDHVTDYAYSITNFLPVDTNNVFSFEGVFCFGDIPFDTMYSMLKNANYFGLPPESSYITNIVDAAKERYETGRKSDSARVYILSGDRMKNLFLTGKTVDHVDVFRPLTKEEIRRMVDYYLNSNRFKYRFFNSEYSNKCIECAIADDFGIILWDASLGYGKKHFQTVISHPKAMSVFKSFTEYFWNNCTLSDEESKKKLKNLINEYL